MIRTLNSCTIRPAHAIGRLLAVAGCVVLATSAARAASSCRSAADCRIFLIGYLADNAIDEASGIAASRRRADVLWVINDGDNDPLIYAVGLDGSDRGHSRIGNAHNRDWEDLAAFTCEGTDYLLIGDCGDNENRRKSCILYIVREPRLTVAGIVDTAPLTWVSRIEYVYADGPRDCEGVAVDVRHREILLLTKRTEPPVLYSLPLCLTPNDSVQTARPVAKVGGIPSPTVEDLREDPLYGRFRSQPTAMDLSPDGALIAVLTYKQVFVFARRSDEDWRHVFARAPVPLAIPKMRQAEALCFSESGTSLYMTSEKVPAPLYRLDIRP